MVLLRLQNLHSYHGPCYPAKTDTVVIADCQNLDHHQSIAMPAAVLCNPDMVQTSEILDQAL